MSMYGEYILEHRGDGIIENEHGFVTYRMLNNNTQVYIVDIYVRPEFRKSYIASVLADCAVKIGKENGAKEVLGTVVPSAKNATQSLRVLIGYGMTLVSATNDLLLFKKEI